MAKLFNIEGRTSYEIIYIYGGEGQKTKYTFITVVDEVYGKQKYPNRLKINVWGENLAETLNVGDFIFIDREHLQGVGEDISQDRNDSSKVYKNVIISCSSSAIVPDLTKKGVKSIEKNEDLSPVEDNDLPF